jgi:hypothetical protein
MIKITDEEEPELDSPKRMIDQSEYSLKSARMNLRPNRIRDKQ